MKRSTVVAANLIRGPRKSFAATIALLLALIPSLSRNLFAAPDYPFKLIVPNITGDVDQVQFDPTQFSITLTNIPGGGRRGVLEFIGSTGGGGTNTVLVAERGVLLTSQGTGTNGIGVDFSMVVSNQMNGVQLNGGSVVSTADTTDFYPLASNPAGYLTSANGITSLNGAAMLASNNAFSAGTTQSMDVVTANVGTFTRGSIAGWSTNKSGFAVAVTRGTDGSDTYNVDGTQVALLASNQTFTATNNFTGPAFIKGSTVISNSPSIIGDLSVTGTVSAAKLSGALSGANLTGIGSVATDLLARVSNNSGTIGGAGNYLVVTFDPNTGLPISWTTVTGPPVGAATNAVTYLQNANNGSAYNNVNGIIFTNLPYFTQNQSTNTIGFSNVVFDTVQVSQGGTNFVLHGAMLSFTNANTQGGTLTLDGSGTVVFGGSISNLLPGSGLPTSFSYSHTAADNGSGSGTLTANALGGDLYITPSSNFTGQAINFSLDGTTSYTFKHDTGTSVATKEFKTGLVNDLAAVYQISASLGKPGLTWDFVAPHECVMIDLGFPWTAVGYNTESESANLVIDQFDNQSSDSHKWYFGNNTNAPMLVLKAGGQQSTSATGIVQNSDWVGLQAWSATNGLPRGGGIVLASNEDFFVVGFTRGMSTNGITAGSHYSTNATDHLQIRTNDFIGAVSGANGLFGSAYANVKAWCFRDDTNGLIVLSALTNGLWFGTTNNLQQKQVMPLP